MPVGDTALERLPAPDRELRPVEEVALCLSGGGYRAMVFHLGALRRLNELAYLPRLHRVSSVSGGSLTAAVLGLNWGQLEFVDGVAHNFDEVVTSQVVELARTTIDRGAFSVGALLPGRSAGEELAQRLIDDFFGDATVQDLPGLGEGPLFVICATSLQTGKLFRFSRPYQGDYTVGLWREPVTPVALAVAASAGFPPVFSPLAISPSGTFDKSTAGVNGVYPYTSRHELADGGVYDNLGLETAWQSYRTILVSDGGGALAADADPTDDKIRHSIRAAKIADQQVRDLRKRQVIDGYTRNDDRKRLGTYWSIRSSIEDYGLSDPLSFTPKTGMAPAGVRTRLKELDDRAIDDISEFGYVICDTAMRRWVERTAPSPDQPYSVTE